MVASPSPNPQSSRVEIGTGSSRIQKRLHSYNDGDTSLNRGARTQKEHAKVSNPYALRFYSYNDDGTSINRGTRTQREYAEVSSPYALRFYSYNDDDTSIDRGTRTQRKHAKVSSPYALRLYSYNDDDTSINRGAGTRRKHAEVSSPYALRQLPDLVSSLCQDFSLARRCSTAARHNVQEPMAVVDVATNTPSGSRHSETVRLRLTTYISVDRHVSCVCRYDKCIQELKTLARRVEPSSQNEERLRSETAASLSISEQTQTSLLSDILKPREVSGRGGCVHHKETVSQKEDGHRAGSERRWETLAVVDNIPEMYEPESSYQPQLDNSDCTLPFLVLDKEVANMSRLLYREIGRLNQELRDDVGFNTKPSRNLQSHTDQSGGIERETTKDEDHRHGLDNLSSGTEEEDTEPKTPQTRSFRFSPQAPHGLANYRNAIFLGSFEKENCHQPQQRVEVPHVRHASSFRSTSLSKCNLSEVSLTLFSAPSYADDGDVQTSRDASIQLLDESATLHITTSISQCITPQNIFHNPPSRTVCEFSSEDEDLILEHSAILPTIRQQSSSLQCSPNNTQTSETAVFESGAEYVVPQTLPPGAMAPISQLFVSSPHYPTIRDFSPEEESPSLEHAAISKPRSSKVNTDSDVGAFLKHHNQPEVQVSGNRLLSESETFLVSRDLHECSQRDSQEHTHNNTSPEAPPYGLHDNQELEVPGVHEEFDAGAASLSNCSAASGSSTNNKPIVTPTPSFHPKPDGRQPSAESTCPGGFPRSEKSKARIADPGFNRPEGWRLSAWAAYKENKHAVPEANSCAFPQRLASQLSSEKSVSGRMYWSNSNSASSVSTTSAGKTQCTLHTKTVTSASSSKPVTAVANCQLPARSTLFQRRRPQGHSLRENCEAKANQGQSENTRGKSSKNSGSGAQGADTSSDTISLAENPGGRRWLQKMQTLCRRLLRRDNHTPKSTVAASRSGHAHTGNT